MIQTFSFLSNEVSLVYAMAFTRSKKTKRVIKTPEIEFLIRNKPVLVLDHKVMWQILDLMDIKSKFSYGNYMRMMDEEPENFSDLINSHLKSYPNVLFYGVTENDVLKEISMDKGDKLGLKTKIVTSEIAKKLAEAGFDFSLSWTKGGLTAHYIRKNTVIEIFIKRHDVQMSTRIKIRGVWLQPTQSSKHSGHIGTMSAKWFFDNVELFLDQIKKIPTAVGDKNQFLLPTKFHTFWDKMRDNPYYDDMPMSDRNDLEWERWATYDKMISQSEI